MGQINISNSKGRDAMVNTQSVRSATNVRWLDEKKRQASTVRLLKATLSRDIKALEKLAGGLEKVAQLLLDGDPEIDIEIYGRALRDTTRVFINPDGELVHKVKQFEIVRNPDGTETWHDVRPEKVPGNKHPRIGVTLPINTKLSVATISGT